MRKRKTVSIASIVGEANRMLSLVTMTSDEKQGICTLVESVLMSANAYRGFNYNYYWHDTGCKEWRAAGEPEGPEKDKYIYGPSGCQYARRYYV